jgi:hypothetical protein
VAIHAVSAVIARPQAVAIHAVRSHGLLHCVRNDGYFRNDSLFIARRASDGIVIARSASDVAIHGP